MCVMGSWRVALRTMDKEMAIIIHETTMHVNPTPRMFTSREWYSQVIYVLTRVSACNNRGDYLI
jgi:hypothetical protein